MIQQFYQVVVASLDHLFQDSLHPYIPLQQSRRTRTWMHVAATADRPYRIVRLEGIPGREEFALYAGCNSKPVFPEMSLTDHFLDRNLPLDARAPFKIAAHESILSYFFLGEVHDGLDSTFEAVAPTTRRLAQAIVSSGRDDGAFEQLGDLCEVASVPIPPRNRVSEGDVERLAIALFGPIRLSTDWQFVDLLGDIHESDVDGAMGSPIANACAVLNSCVLPYLAGDLSSVPSAP